MSRSHLRTSSLNYLKVNAYKLMTRDDSSGYMETYGGNGFDSDTVLYRL